MKKTILSISAVILVLVITAFSFASCGSSKAMDTGKIEGIYSGNKYGFSAANGIDEDYIEEETRSYEDGGKSDSAQSKNGLNIEDAQTRKIIRNASLDVETKEFDKFTAEIEKAVSDAKGYIESSEIHGNSYYYSDGNRSATMKFRIPADSLDAFLEKIGDMANVRAKSVSATDITANYTDIQARIDSLETERKALLAILEKADKISDIIQVQDKITSVNADLDSYKRSIKNYDSLIAYSQVTVDISEVERVSTASTKLGFLQELKERLSDNFYDIGQGLRNFAVWFISSIPYFLIFGAIAAVVIIIVKKVIKKKRARKAAKAKEEKGE
ncbi:MAG: DUF4349 domain-containing protein [Clostridia bacterium]|nr:DUF4349 domain-containing protein [Clostridia bacterium]